MEVAELLAREEIKQLRLAYAAFYDRQLLDKLVDLFTEDAVCDFGHYGSWNGRAEIRSNYERELARNGPFHALHIVTNPFIEFTGDGMAHGTWYLMDLLPRQKPANELSTPGGHDNPLLYIAIYEDQYRKTAGAWKIQRTQLHFLWPEWGDSKLPIGQ